MRLYDDAFGPSARKLRLMPRHKRLVYEAFDAVYPTAGRMGWARL